MAAIESSEIQPAGNTRTGEIGSLFVARRLQPEYNCTTPYLPILQTHPFHKCCSIKKL